MGFQKGLSLIIPTMIALLLSACGGVEHTESFSGRAGDLGGTVSYTYPEAWSQHESTAYIKSTANLEMKLDKEDVDLSFNVVPLELGAKTGSFPGVEFEDLEATQATDILEGMVSYLGSNIEPEKISVGKYTNSGMVTIDSGGRSVTLLRFLTQIGA